MEILWRSADCRHREVTAALRRDMSVLPYRWGVDGLSLVRLPEIGAWCKGRVLDGTTGNPTCRGRQ
jgi:hypothetical protein